MIDPLSWTVLEDGGHAVVTVRGQLNLTGTTRLRTALLKCLAEQPDALLVDLSAVTLADDTNFSLFTAIARQAARWPGTPLLICAPAPEIAALLGRGRYGRLPVYPGVAEGRSAVAEGRVVVPSISDRLLPIAGAVRHARNLATEACLAWDLPELVGPVALVASELVTNAIEHAGTTITVEFKRRARHVYVTVRDGSAAEPVLRDPAGLALRGRGLALVDNVAARWGWLPTRDGKVVWAAVAT
jgi:anti-anti-sigma regulatory factor/anti-sigma regulatory factor (Ser/Thr protein kinase)